MLLWHLLLTRESHSARISLRFSFVSSSEWEVNVSWYLSRENVRTSQMLIKSEMRRTPWEIETISALLWTFISLWFANIFQKQPWQVILRPWRLIVKWMLLILFHGETELIWFWTFRNSLNPLMNYSSESQQ